VIIFGVITLIPALLDVFESPKDTGRRVNLLQYTSYRFLKRLVTGYSMWILLLSAVLLLASNVFSLVSLLLEYDTGKFIGFCMTVVAIILILFTIIYIAWRANSFTDDEYEMLRDHSPDDE
jgi:uncharacterized membrane protein